MLSHIRISQSYKYKRPLLWCFVMLRLILTSTLKASWIPWFQSSAFNIHILLWCSLRQPTENKKVIHKFRRLEKTVHYFRIVYLNCHYRHFSWKRQGDFRLEVFSWHIMETSEKIRLIDIKKCIHCIFIYFFYISIYYQICYYMYMLVMAILEIFLVILIVGRAFNICHSIR